MGIAVLGPLTIEGEEKVLGRRDRVVLAALVVRPGDVVSAEALADVLWGEQLPASWAKNLQGCVVRLRKLLGSHAIETSPLGYRLTVPLDQIDAQRFERAVGRAGDLLAAGEAERSALVLADALTLWRGRPLTELEGWDTARIEAARLTELRRAAEELYVESALRAGQQDKLMAKAQAFVAEAPLRERRWALLATAQYQAGRQTEALRTLRQLRTVLNRELGLDPGPDIEALERAILRQDPSLVVASAVPEASTVCPYQGLKPYDVEDTDGFFGRDADVAECLRKLSDTSVLAVVGPSGCGKSSLVRAGVAATLRRSGQRVVVITPGVHPVAALAAAIPGKGPAPVLLVDQCEEVFSLCQHAAERDAFLTALTAHRSVAPLILSFRADRLADVSTHPGFARAVEQGLYLLTGMAEADLRAAIEEPARLASLVVEPGLVDLLVNEVADEPGALPLMSHALAETWQRREGRTLSVAGYNASGGIRSAVARSADEIYDQLPAEQRPVLRDLLLRLVTPGPEGEPVRSRLPRRLVVTGRDNDAMVDLLVGARLVTSDDGVVELAHEALARAWPRLRGWLDDDLQGQRILHHLATVADAWDTLGRPDSELYRGPRLANALDWREGSKPTLTETEQAFLAASKRLSEAELRAAEDSARHQIRVNRRLRTALGTAALLLVGALVAGLVAVSQANRADQEAAAAEAAAVVADAGRAGAKAVIQDDIDASLLLAAAGAQLHETAESRANLLAVIAQHGQLIHSVATGRGDITGLDVSPDGKTVAVYDVGGALLLYDSSSGKLLAEDRPKNGWAGGLPRDGAPQPVAFSPGGHSLAVTLPSPTTEPVRLLNPHTLEQSPQRLPGFGEIAARATQVAYSQDGNTLVAVLQLFGNGPWTFYTGQTVIVWNVRPGVPPSVRMRLHREVPAADRDEYGMDAAVLSPHGDRLYSSNPLTGYDIATKKILFTHPTMAFYDIDASPDGRLLALAGTPWNSMRADTEHVILVDAGTGETVRALRGHTERVSTARFSHDGHQLASTAGDLRVNVWDVDDGSVVEQLRVGDQELQSVGFSTDDKTLYTAEDDGTLRSWDLAGRRRYIDQTRTPTSFVYGCVMPAPGGRTIWRQTDTPQTGSADRFIDVATGKPTKPTPLGPGDRTQSCGTWHPNGQRFASVVGSDVSVRDARTGRLLSQLKVPGPHVQDLDYSGRDGTRLIIGQASGMVTMLDSDTLKKVGKQIRLPDPVQWLTASPDNRSAVVLTGRGTTTAMLAFPATQWALVDLQEGRIVRRGTLDLHDPQTMTFSPDGRRVAIGSGLGEVLVLDSTTGAAVRPPQRVHRDWTNGLAYSADGSLLVSSGSDGSVNLFDGNTAILLGSVVVPHLTLATSDFLSDGRTVVIASYDDGIYVWDTRLEHAIKHACKMAGRDLTTDEWRDNFRDRPYRKTCP